MKYIHLQFDARNQEPGLVDKSVAIISDETNQPVYTYCNTATRVGALWMIARVMEDGLEIDAAREEVEAQAGIDGLLWVSERKILGGTYGFSILPGVTNNAHANVTAGGSRADSRR